MATPRLTFLYPQLLKGTRVWEPPSNFSALRRARDRRPATAGRHSKRGQSNFAQQRYGQAAEPLPPPKAKKDGPKQELLPALSSEAESESKDADTATAKSTKNPESETSSKLKDDPPEQSSRASDKPASDIDAQTERASPESSAPAPKTVLDAAEAHPAEPTANPTPALSLVIPENSGSQPLDRVLHIESPSGRSKPPHLQPPPYVHHFDTYTLVKGLGAGGFTEPQSVTLMKAVRSLLAVNMDLARAGLVSKSDVENEMYLFRAACSELRTEIQHSRHAGTVRQRSDLAHLQHDSDILAQKTTQELNTLKDELKGLFDDRKMSVRGEQRRANASIEETNRRIQVDLQSDGRGKVEGLRWSLAKRAVIVIGATAAVGLLFLRYTTYALHKKETEERDREARLKGEDAARTLDDGGGGGGAHYLSRPSPGADSDDVLASAQGGSKGAGGRSGVGYVSLG